MGGVAKVTIRPMAGADWPRVWSIYAAGIATGNGTFEPLQRASGRSRPGSSPRTRPASPSTRRAVSGSSGGASESDSLAECSVTSC
jgi:hypothetical protein